MRDLAVLAIGILLGAAPVSAALSYDFEGDPGGDEQAGWETPEVFPNEDYGGPNFLDVRQLFELSSGVDNGYLRITDQDAATPSGLFPVKFQGDLSAYNRGFLSYEVFLGDVRFENPNIPRASHTGASFGTIKLFVDDDPVPLIYSPTYTPPTNLNWTRYDAPWTSEAFNTTNERWEESLRHVRRVEIDLDPGDFDRLSLDNFALLEEDGPHHANAPEPASMALMGMGLLGLARARRRRA